MTTIHLRHASLRPEEWGCTTIFHDGATRPAVPHDTHHYAVIAHRCGYGDDALAYCREHELAHLVAEQFLHDRPSRILWGLAHDAPLPAHDCAYEELAAQTLQRFARAAERPIVGGTDWDAMRALFLTHAAELRR